jgi:HupE / UreJ protein
LWPSRRKILEGTYRRAFAGRAAIALLAAVMVGRAVPSLAHDIPADITVRAFVRPEGQRLRLLIRVPMSAMRDIDWPRRPDGFLDLARLDPFLRDASTLWIGDDIELFEGDVRLAYPQVRAVRLSLEADAAFATYEEALARVIGPRLPDDTRLLAGQGLLDVLFEYPIRSDRSGFSIRPRFERLGLRTVTVLRLLPPGGAIRAFELDGDPGLVRLDPRWYQAAWRFVQAGFFHILDGTDHLLFLFCLVIPFRRFRSLFVVVTAFTAAHSITLIASAYGFAPDALWFPPLIEVLIAISIVYMALENIVSPQLKRRWMMTFGFGLVHGFGFSFALRQTLQFAGSHLLTSLLSFNIGVELGQLLVLLLLIPALDLLFRFVVAERTGTIILSTLVAHTGWHWMVERVDVLRRYQFQWPALDVALLAGAMRWAMWLVIAGGLYWLVMGPLRQLVNRPPGDQPAVGAKDLS